MKIPNTHKNINKMSVVLLQIALLCAVTAYFLNEYRQNTIDTFTSYREASCVLAPNISSVEQDYCYPTTETVNLSKAPYCSKMDRSNCPSACTISSGQDKTRVTIIYRVNKTRLQVTKFSCTDIVPISRKPISSIYQPGATIFEDLARTFLYHFSIYHTIQTLPPFSVLNRTEPIITNRCLKDCVTSSEQLAYPRCGDFNGTIPICEKNGRFDSGNGCTVPPYILSKNMMFYFYLSGFSAAVCLIGHLIVSRAKPN